MIYEDNLKRGAIKTTAQLSNVLGEKPKMITLKPKQIFHFEKKEISGNFLFDIQNQNGSINIIVNTKHPASKYLSEALEKCSDSKNDSFEAKALKIMLMSWGSLENEATIETKQHLEDIRQDWGRVAREVVKAEDVNEIFYPTEALQTISPSAAH
jgi:hypothetical protein